MIIQQTGSRGTILTFDDGISVFLIHGSRFHLLCDTHLGPQSMEKVISFLADKIRPDPVIVFNSHSDWDHIWGNCSFPDSLIIGHEFCRNRIIERGSFDLQQNFSLCRGDVVLTPPLLTFSDRLVFENEDIEFSYAPGHTIDSAICYDKRDQVLYLGDLVEDPIPYLDAEDLDTYIKTLQTIFSHPARVLISAHSGIVTRDLVNQNISYIAKVKEGIQINPEEFGSYQSVHRWNMIMRIIWEYESVMKERMGEDISHMRILEQIGDLHDISPEKLNHVLDRHNYDQD
jgi:glyoxylase-like metal-dependent hydrolase (beta-lactamase superfamily II)